MNELFQFAKDILGGNNNFLDFIGIIIVAVTSYIVARYTALRPNKQRVKQLQFDNIYLPLFKLLKDVHKDLSLEKAKDLHGHISFILDTYYEFAFPQLHVINNQFGDAIAKGLDFDNFFIILKHQVFVDYELLKKDLGYPSANIFSIFSRMTRKQKFEKLLTLMNVIFVFIPLFLMMVIFPDDANNGIVLTLAIYAILAIVINVINRKLP